ncbi:type 4a pilus biogenesis protein PilO [bacterium]
MTTINLVPADILHKEKTRTLYGFIYAAIFSLLFFAALIYGFRYLAYRNVLGEIKKLNNDLQQLQVVVNKVKQIEFAQKSLDNRIIVIRDLLKTKYLYAKFLEDFANCIPNRLWVRFMQTKGVEGKLNINCNISALNNFTISRFMERLKRYGKFDDVELTYIKTTYIGTIGLTGVVVNDALIFVNTLIKLKYLFLKKVFMAAKNEQKDKQEKILLLILFLGLLWAGYKYLYEPLGVKLDTAETELKKNYSAYNSLKTKTLSLDLMKKDLTELEEVVKLTEARIPQVKNVPSLLRSITTDMNKYLIKMSNLVPQKTIDKGHYLELPFKMDTTAKYHNLARFFAALGNSDRIIHVKDLQFSFRNKSELDNNNIRATFYLIAYSFKKG